MRRHPFSSTMVGLILPWAIAFFWVTQGCPAWGLTSSKILLSGQPLGATADRSSEPADDSSSSATVKSRFIDSLDRLNGLNEYSKERSQLLEKLIATKIDVPVDQIIDKPLTSTPPDRSIALPGRWENMSPIAAGDWKVVYAPHMTTMAKLAGGGEFEVSYLLNNDGSMTSHARCDFPFLRSLLGQSCIYLSVSGTYGSQSDQVCQVDFDKAWVKTIPTIGDNDTEDVPYSRLGEVPDSPWKDAITRLGRLFFIKEVSVFPISFMDEDLIVFDFELLGTRIVATKRS